MPVQARERFNSLRMRMDSLDGPRNPPARDSLPRDPVQAHGLRMQALEFALESHCVFESALRSVVCVCLVTPQARVGNADLSSSSTKTQKRVHDERRHKKTRE